MGVLGELPAMLALRVGVSLAHVALQLLLCRGIGAQGAEQLWLARDLAYVQRFLFDRFLAPMADRRAQTDDVETQLRSSHNVVGSEVRAGPLRHAALAALLAPELARGRGGGRRA